MGVIPSESFKVDNSIFHIHGAVIQDLENRQLSIMKLFILGIVNTNDQKANEFLSYTVNYEWMTNHYYI